MAGIELSYRNQQSHMHINDVGDKMVEKPHLQVR